MAFSMRNSRNDGLSPNCDDILRTHLGKFTLDDEPVRIVISGAAGQLGYSLVHPIASGQVFGPKRDVIIILFDVEAMMPVLRGLFMEVSDCSLPRLKGFEMTSDLKTAFTDVDVVIILASVSRTEKQDDDQFLASMVRVARVHGVAIDRYAKKTAKVLVVSHPSQTLALICAKHASSIPPHNFASLVRLDFNRATSQIAAKAGLSNRYVRNVVIWGGNEHRAVIDSSRVELCVNGQWKNASRVIYDDVWMRHKLADVVGDRTETIQKIRPLACSLSTVMAICAHLYDWWHGTEAGRWISMGVQSDGSYGIEPGLFFSFPTTVDADGRHHIVDGLVLDKNMKDKLSAAASVLAAERDAAVAIDDALPPSVELEALASSSSSVSSAASAASGGGDGLKPIGH